MNTAPSIWLHAKIPLSCLVISAVFNFFFLLFVRCRLSYARTRPYITEKKYIYIYWPFARIEIMYQELSNEKENIIKTTTAR